MDQGHLLCPAMRPEPCLVVFLLGRPGYPATNSRCGRSLLRAEVAGRVPDQVVGVSPARELKGLPCTHTRLA